MQAPNRVLIVDDNVLAANALVRLLQVLGWNAEAAYSANDARKHLESKEVDSMILDIGMPRMDGYEFIRIVREELQLGIPVIALTGYGQGEDRQKALDAGFTAHLTKPVGMKELQATLTELLCEPVEPASC